MSNITKALSIIGVCNMLVGFGFLILGVVEWATFNVATATMCFVLAKEGK